MVHDVLYRPHATHIWHKQFVVFILFEIFLVGSQGSSTKNCKWTPTAGSTTAGTCSDTICTDAPTTLATLA